MPTGVQPAAQGGNGAQLWGQLRARVGRLSAVLAPSEVLVPQRPPGLPDRAGGLACLASFAGLSQPTTRSQQLYALAACLVFPYNPQEQAGGFFVALGPLFAVPAFGCLFILWLKITVTLVRLYLPVQIGSHERAKEAALPQQLLRWYLRARQAQAAAEGERSLA